jgi:hypothetical protein
MKDEDILFSLRNWNCAVAKCCRQVTLFDVRNKLVSVQSVLRMNVVIKLR